MPLGSAWLLEYSMFCLGISFATAGAIAGAYKAGSERIQIIEELEQGDIITIVRQRCDTERLRRQCREPMPDRMAQGTQAGPFSDRIVVGRTSTWEWD